MNEVPEALDIAAKFETAHNAAFRHLHAQEPGQRWSAFDVPRPDAKQGKASRLVITVWNRHAKIGDGIGWPISHLALALDRASQTLWYRVGKPPNAGARKTWIAHWNAVNLAISQGVPIVGVLKDAESHLCALGNLFDCTGFRWGKNRRSIWLELEPRSEVGTATVLFDIDKFAGSYVSIDAEASRLAAFDRAVRTAMGRTSAERRRRLAKARRSPETRYVRTKVFLRNSDVVAEVLYRADGRCESCGKNAPFRRRTDKTPYLEVHHRKQLAHRGEDTVRNALAVCPNCHRKFHFG